MPGRTHSIPNSGIAPGTALLPLVSSTAAQVDLPRTEARPRPVACADVQRYADKGGIAARSMMRMGKRIMLAQPPKREMVLLPKLG